ncbi:MAG: MBL fold metallo-hydrolase [Lachnospiraceae bacterium]|jgi:L-ascorbate metabolism protein UlaG (beta-lactamase superfamily)|nr:MBL fold metallo-hydrolase [Lachnospiraceae bacterium]
MLSGVQVLYHSSIKIKKDLTIYVDPYKIEEEYADADIIFITHTHFDHFSIPDIKKITKEDTVIVTVPDTEEELKNIGFNPEEIVVVKPNSKYKVKNIEFKTVPAYNVKKEFHPKSKLWVGYNIKINEKWYYILGDTDNIKEVAAVKADVMFVPVGGTYTMDYKEAAKLVNEVKPVVAIPTHYGSVVGNKSDAFEFTRLLNKQIDYEIYF